MRLLLLSAVVGALLVAGGPVAKAQDSTSAEVLSPEQRVMAKRLRLAAADEALVVKEQEREAYLADVDAWSREYQDGQDRQTTAAAIVAISSIAIGAGLMVAGLAVDEDSSAFGPLLGSGMAVLLIGGLTGAFMFPSGGGV